MRNPWRFIISIAVCQAVGLVSTPFTVAAINSWYATLVKPTFSPPNWVFAPAWTTLYAMMGIALYLVWNHGVSNKNVKSALRVFAAQLFFNFLWSILFFGLRSPILALIDIAILWFLIVASIAQFAKISGKAAILLIPYLLWVSFAALLNLSIVLLN